MRRRTVCSLKEGASGEGNRETNQRFYQALALLEGQGATPGCGQIAVKTYQPVEKIGSRPSVG
jgi:hypothetical protein